MNPSRTQQNSIRAASPFITTAALLLTGIFVAAAWSKALAQEPVSGDVLLLRGTLFDGTGADGYAGDVALRDGKIAAVGKFDRGSFGLVIDCRGLIVAPGFIDLHNHSDRKMADASTRANVNFLTQGCTTIVTGNCGGGPIDIGKYIDEVNEAGAGTNVAPLVPHGSVRSSVFGSQRRPPTSDELAKMCELAEKGMRDGAWGMSTGLIYVPGTYSETDELVAVAKVIGKHGGFYASHIRNEGAGLLDAVSEAIQIGQRAELPVHISHFEASGREAWGSLRAAAELVEKARTAGQRVTADQYPYIASSTSLEAMVIPTWAREGGQKALLARLDDSEQGPNVVEAIAQRLKERNKMVIASYRKRADWVGKSLDEIAELEKRPAVEIVLEITRNGGASAVSFGMNEEDVRYAMTLPWVATASDGGTRLPDADRPHPRSFGTFSRKIGRYALAEKVLSPAQAIRSASGLPADILGMTDRGYLRAGAAADVVAFDPETFLDSATFDDPFQYSSGMKYVFVAGKPAIYEGTPTGALSGRALRHAIKDL